MKFPSWGIVTMAVALTSVVALLTGCGSSGTATTTVKTIVERVSSPSTGANAPTATEPAGADGSEQETVATTPKPSKHVGSYVGERLDVAESDAEESGIDVKVLGGGTFGVVVPSHWTVCKQEPSPGATANRVKLIVAREC